MTYPLSVLRVRQGADCGIGKEGRQFTGTVDCFKKIYKNGGLSHFYKGMIVSDVGIVTYRGLYFGLYDTGKHLLFGNNIKQAPILALWIFAQFVTVSCGAITYPLSLARNRYILTSGEKNPQFSGAFDCLKKTYAQDGIRGWYRGFLFSTLTATGGSIVLVIYDKFLSFGNN
jgi:solute carrier family 25 (adenine nucleotide translocator) protein 4/5/6/31